MRIHFELCSEKIQSLHLAKVLKLQMVAAHVHVFYNFNQMILKQFKILHKEKNAELLLLLFFFFVIFELIYISELVVDASKFASDPKTKNKALLWFLFSIKFQNRGTFQV